MTTQKSSKKKRPGTVYKNRTEVKLKEIAPSLVEAAQKKDSERLYALVEEIRTIMERRRVRTLSAGLSLEELRQELQKRTAQYEATLDVRLADKLEREIANLARRIRAIQRGGGK